jgi:hypothetical protein
MPIMDNKIEEIMNNLTPENAFILFNQLRSKFTFNTSKAYVQVITPRSGCTIYIPCNTQDEKVMQKTKDFYKELLNISEI